MARATEAIRARMPGRARRVLDKIGSEDLFMLSAGLAFYAIVSVAPMAIVSLWLTGMIIGDQQVRELARALGEIGPSGMGLDTFVQKVAGVGVGIGIGALITGLWPASAYGSGLARAFDRVSSKRRHQLKGLRGRGLFLLVLLPVFVMGSIVGGLAAGAVLGEGFGARVVGWALTLLAVFVVATGITAIIYRIYPHRTPDTGGLVRGSVFTGVGVAVLSLLLVVYLNSGANFTDHYAVSALAGLVMLGLWLFASNALMLLGYGVAMEGERT